MFWLIFQATRTILKIHKAIIVKILLSNEQVLRQHTPLQAKFGLHVGNNKLNEQNEI